MFSAGSCQTNAKHDHCTRCCLQRNLFSGRHLFALIFCKLDIHDAPDVIVSPFYKDFSRVVRMMMLIFYFTSSLTSICRCDLSVSEIGGKSFVLSIRHTFTWKRCLCSRFGRCREDLCCQKLGLPMFYAHGVLSNTTIVSALL